MTFLRSQEPAHCECIEDSEGKWSVGLWRIVGECPDDAVKRLNYGHSDSQEPYRHSGANAHGDKDRQQQSEASRSRIAGEGVAATGAE